MQVARRKPVVSKSNTKSPVNGRLAKLLRAMNAGLGPFVKKQKRP